MRRDLKIIGAFVLLLIVQSGASKSSNRKNFWDIKWLGGGNEEPAATSSDDFTLDTEGSGFDVTAHGMHVDDEDFDVGSGDGDIVEASNDSDDIDIKPMKPEKTVTTDDEDDYLDGSGSGDGEDVYEPIVPEYVKPIEQEVTTTRQLTACENLRNSAKQATTAFMPECDMDGGFMKKQCMVDIREKEKHCWCVDPHGIEITGTRMKHPESPDCSFGENLSTCVFQLVQHSQGMLGAYKPSCTLDGDYEPIQCQGSQCWCVDKLGNELTGTMSQKPNMPKCPSETTPVVIVIDEEKPKTSKPKYIIPTNPSEDIDNVDVVVNPDIPIDSQEADVEDNEETNESSLGGDNYPTKIRNEGILAQPGLLAAVIGGAVVGLLCMVLLVMFIVYRMRKKDEGSYPLDEQKYQNYSYAKAPDREFYA